MPDYLDAAANAFTETRAIYTGVGLEPGTFSRRHKSSNKMFIAGTSALIGADYLTDDEMSRESDNNRVARWLKANESVGKIRDLNQTVAGSYLDMGMLLRVSKAQGMNCGELAAVAADIAWRRLGKPKPAPIAMVSLSQPADHVFCAVGDPALLAAAHGKCIDDLHLSLNLIDAYAIDPWLNICCSLDDYGTEADDKFTKWQGANKRVAWCDGPQGSGWYAPEGAYRDGFMDATLVVEMV